MHLVSVLLLELLGKLGTLPPTMVILKGCTATHRQLYSSVNAGCSGMGEFSGVTKKTTKFYRRLVGTRESTGDTILVLETCVLITLQTD